MEKKSRSNTARFMDYQGNKGIIQLNDKYNNQGLLENMGFTLIGTGTNSHLVSDESYDFTTFKKTITKNNSLTNEKKSSIIQYSSKEEMKLNLLKRFNDSKIKLLCSKDGCADPECCPKLSVGNKIFNSVNTKSPYFSSSCNASEYYESELHLNTKIDIFQNLLQRSRKPNSSIKNVEIEKVFNFGNGQERRSDVYYEKHYSDKNGEPIIEKISIEVQRSNIDYDELKERTDWYKKNNIGVLWVVVDTMFNKNNVENLHKKDFKLPLLTLISFSMKEYNNRFYVYDSDCKKVMALTVQKKEVLTFNESNQEFKIKFKNDFSTNSLYLVSNKKNQEGFYELKKYKDSRLSNDIYSDFGSFKVFPDSTIIHRGWDQNKKKYEVVKFLAIANAIQQSRPKLKI